MKELKAKNAAYMRKYRQRNLAKFKQKERERSKQSRMSGTHEAPETKKLRNAKRDPVKLSSLSENRRIAIRDEMIKVYGGKCECCGENEPQFLTIDHINNDGAEHRKKIGSGINLYRNLKNQGWPKEGLRLLCFNCNCGRSRNGGTCPHKERI